MAKATGLGKGLDALLGEEFTAADGALTWVDGADLTAADPSGWRYG